MNDDEFREYWETHTFIGASERLNRVWRELWHTFLLELQRLVRRRP